MRADSTESSRPSDCVGTLIKTKDGTFVVMKAVFDPDQVPTFGTMAMVAHLRKQFPHRGRQAPMVAMITVPPGYDTSPRLERTEKKLKKKGIHIVGIPNSPCPVPSTEAMERFAARLALELEQAGDDAAAARRAVDALAPFQPGQLPVAHVHRKDDTKVVICLDVDGPEEQATVLKELAPDAKRITVVREVWTLSVGPDASVDATLVPSEHPDRKTMTWVESLSRYGTLKRLYRVETRDGAERVSPRPYTDEYKVRGVDNAEVKAFHHGDVFDGVW